MVHEQRHRRHHHAPRSTPHKPTLVCTLTGVVPDLQRPGLLHVLPHVDDRRHDVGVGPVAVHGQRAVAVSVGCGRCGNRGGEERLGP